MKISMSMEIAETRMSVSPEDAAKLMKEAGFDGIDLSMCEFQTEPEKQAQPEWSENILREANAAVQAGLEVCQCHLPFFPGHITKPGDGGYLDYEAFCLPGVFKGLELCHQVGCPVAVLHPYYDDLDEKNCIEGNIHMVGKLIPTLEKYNIKLALENIYCHQYEKSNMSYPEQIMAVLEKLDHPLVGACLDTGHANVFNIDNVQAVRTYGRRLFALHANANSNSRLTDNHVLPCMMGDGIRWTEVSAALKEVGYRGAYNMEIGTGCMPASVTPAFYRFAATVARELSRLAE